MRLSDTMVFLILSVTAALGADTTRPGDPAKGKAVFEQCKLCHDPESTKKKVGPGLKGLFTRPKMQSGIKITEESVRARIERGGNGMPAYRTIIRPEDRDNLVAYLKTL